MCCSFADLDRFVADDIIDPIAKAKMVALKGIKRVLAQDPMVVPPGINRYFCFCVYAQHHPIDDSTGYDLIINHYWPPHKLQCNMRLNV